MKVIAFGSNMPSIVGTPARTLHLAIAELGRRDIRVLAVSSLYETQAWPDPRDPLYVNAVCKIDTELSPKALLAQLHAIESAFGRVRDTRNAPRTLDIDIIDCDGRIEDGPPVLPHPRVESRAFVLIPLRDVAPDWQHPVSHRSVDELIAALPPEARAIRRIE
jgi:2-amino-4-hydroxy-6-hydroxymethyldihydropteridine diphosphokinase